MTRKRQQRELRSGEGGRSYSPWDVKESMGRGFRRVRHEGGLARPNDGYRLNEFGNEDGR